MSQLDRFLEDLNKTPAARTEKRTRQWRPVLGQTLEYGDTGYIIVLNKNNKKAPFRLQDPDGRVLAEGDSLPKFKAYAEEQTRFRDEFEPSPELLNQLPKWESLK